MEARRLLFFVSDEFPEKGEDLLRTFVEDLGQRRSWSNGAPVFVDEVDDSSCTQPEDEPIRTLGGFLELPPRGAPRREQQAALAEVEDLVSALAEFSAEHELEFELELDGAFVGDIRGGRVGRLLGEGLIGEWKRSLG